MERLRSGLLAAARTKEEQDTAASVMYKWSGQLQLIGGDVKLEIGLQQGCTYRSNASLVAKGTLQLSKLS